MTGKKQPKTKNLNVPWITKEGYFDLTRFPIDGTLAKAIGPDSEEFRSACTVLGSMAAAGRTEAGVFLFGLLRFCADDRARKEPVVRALATFRSRQCADLLFEELDKTESSNTTRAYINVVLEALRGFPVELTEDGFTRLLADPKWSYKMKRKLRDVLEEVKYGGW